MSMLFKSTEFNMLANKTVVEERVWVRPRNTGLMSASGIAPMLGMIEIPDMRLKDARMANNASVLDHWRGGGEPGPIYGGAAPERDCEDAGAGSGGEKTPSLRRGEKTVADALAEIAEEHRRNN
ncbi:unnamed protein product [Caenorhabditis nigoni]